MTLYFIFKVEGDEDQHVKVVKVLQDVLELITNDLMLNGSRLVHSEFLLRFRSVSSFFASLNFILHAHRTLDALNSDKQFEVDSTELFSQAEPQLFASKHSIHFPLPDSGPLNDQVFIFASSSNLSSIKKS